MESQPPSSRAAISATIVALLDLFASFLMVAGRPTSSVFPLIFFLMCEMALIAIAIHQWSIFLKKYIAYEVERGVRRQAVQP